VRLGEGVGVVARGLGLVVGFGVAEAVGVGLGEGLGEGLGLGVGEGLGLGVGVGEGLGVGVGEGLGEGVGLGEGLAAAVGRAGVLGLAVDRGVGVTAGLGEATGGCTITVLGAGWLWRNRADRPNTDAIRTPIYSITKWAGLSWGAGITDSTRWERTGTMPFCSGYSWAISEPSNPKAVAYLAINPRT